ncbi:hypothetical protein [Pseudomonas protegens]
MAKPPKRMAGTPVPEAPPPAINTASSSQRLPGENPPSADASTDLPSGPARQPSVQIIEGPDTPLSVQAALQSITWPADQVHLLQRLDADSGLFTSPDGKLYAHIENEGHLLVESLVDGRYQIPFSFAPHLPGPFLVKTERQALWTFERPGWLAHNPDHEQQHATAERPMLEQPVYLAPEVAALLSPALQSAEGLRYDKHRKTYIDTPDGTVMVRRNTDGHYQQAFAGAREALPIVFEQIAGTRLWRLKRESGPPVSGPSQKRKASTDSAESAPGPSKRTPQEEAAEPTQALTESLLSANPEAINLSYGLWRNWGRNVPPQLGQHVEIEGQYYRILNQNPEPDPRLVYLLHPLFSPALYDAFEYMLRDSPALQPRWAIKRNNQWTVLDNIVPFEKPITQYISTTFKYLSDQSVSALARAMFNQANRSEIINSHGLAVLDQVFRYWANRQARRAPPRELSDPLLMLRKTDEPSDTLAIPSSLGEGLMRLDFDPGRFSRHWNEYAAVRTTPELHRLFSRLLEDDGYEVNATAQPLGDDALLFHRKKIDQVFVLRLPPLINGRFKRVTTESFAFSDSQLRNLITEQKPLSTFRAENKVIYLLGGAQTDVLGQTTLFVIRDQ